MGLLVDYPLLRGGSYFLPLGKKSGSSIGNPLEALYIQINLYK